MYKITFADDTTFLGGNPDNSLWNEIEDKGIKKLEYRIGKKTIVMMGYDRYNHLLENECILGRKARIVGILLMGELGNRIERIHIDLKEGKIRKSFTKLGQEYKGGLTTGWKKGMKNQEAGWQLI